MSIKSLSVACVGEAMIEMSLDANAPDVAKIGSAGDTLNTAIYLKRSVPEARVAFVTRLGDDYFSGKMLNLMETEKLSTELIDRDPNRLPGIYAIRTDAQGERSFSYWRSASAARQLFTEPSPALEDLSDFTYVYLSAITLAVISSAARARFLDWLRGYRESGGRFVFDSNYRPALWPDCDTARSVIESAWRSTDIGLPSVDDEMALFGDTDEDAVVGRLRSWGVVDGALKRGARGPIALNGSGPKSFEPAARVVDSTAAGDSFNAGYLAARMRELPQDQWLQSGHDLAREVVGVRGAIIPHEKAGAHDEHL